MPSNNFYIKNIKERNTDKKGKKKELNKKKRYRKTY